MHPTAWERLGHYLHETQLLGSIHSTLYWDQNTQMPKRGSAWRGEQLSCMARLLHTRQSNLEYESLITEAKEEYEITLDRGDLTEDQREERRINLMLLKQDLIRQKNLDPELVAELSLAKSEGYDLWQEAKSKDNFKLFEPALSKLIFLRQEQSNQLSEPRSCWETLAQPFEPDITCKRIYELFTPLRNILPDLLENVRSINKPRNSNWDFNEDTQEKLCSQLLSEWGRDEAITAISRSPHPFSTTLGPKDFRITTRIVPGQPLSSFLATAHEWGHSLYEQGLKFQTHQCFSWPLGQATSMAVHESQSLFWENRVARSLAFSDRFWPNFSKAGAPIKCGKDLWLQMNPLQPGLNRVEADELSYGLHILIRTDLEIALLENGLPVKDLPYEWNMRYKNLLGIEPLTDTEGCLQDVHWSEGMFGYFPSYLLGHLISAQFSEAMAKDLSPSDQDPISDYIRSGKEFLLLKWLRQNVHSEGRRMNAELLVEKVSGFKLSSTPFITYLKKKLQMLVSSS